MTPRTQLLAKPSRGHHQEGRPVSKSRTEPQNNVQGEQLRWQGWKPGLSRGGS